MGCSSCSPCGTATPAPVAQVVSTYLPFINFGSFGSGVIGGDEELDNWNLARRPKKRGTSLFMSKKSLYNLVRLR